MYPETRKYSQNTLNYIKTLYFFHSLICSANYTHVRIFDVVLASMRCHGANRLSPSWKTHLCGRQGHVHLRDTCKWISCRNRRKRQKDFVNPTTTRLQQLQLRIVNSRDPFLIRSCCPFLSVVCVESSASSVAWEQSSSLKNKKSTEKMMENIRTQNSLNKIQNLQLDRLMWHSSDLMSSFWPKSRASPATSCHLQPLFLAEPHRAGRSRGPTQAGLAIPNLNNGWLTKPFGKNNGCQICCDWSSHWKRTCLKPPKLWSSTDLTCISWKRPQSKRFGAWTERRSQSGVAGKTWKKMPDWQEDLYFTPGVACSQRFWK